MTKDLLKIDYDVFYDTVTINSVKFSGDFFRYFACPSSDKFFQVKKHEDNTILITQYTITGVIEKVQEILEELKKEIPNE